MKKMIQKWLGIKSDQEIREIADKIVHSENYLQFVSDRITDKLHWREQHAIKRAAADEAVNEIKKTINNEKFIDDVVQRIKNKQI
jgi:hypothetical protein